jgi:lipoprotein-anchoring transpeptidase ErfK/SrfK
VLTAVTVTAWAVLHPAASGSTPLAAIRRAVVSQPVSPGPAGPSTVTTPATSASAGVSRAAYSPCRRNDHSQLVVVSIRRQHAWACAGRRTVLSTPVTTGASSRPGEATPRGTFAVQGLNRNTTLNPSTGESYPVKFWVPFHLGVWGFHDASWQRIPFGSAQYVKHGSHGCVHVPLAAMRQLFHWVKYGTLVRIT